MTEAMRILPYLSMPADFRAYDPQVIEVAHSIAGAIQRVEPRLKVEHDGRPFPIHAHIIALDSDEHRELVFFREALRASSTLRHCLL
jgi:hypothetical protein